ncbi:MAG: hypothetical protein VYD99_04810, partial [Planctomycetota bacterium]|nr:hypothetical protein [Planctomycetota bacterium]
GAEDLTESTSLEITRAWEQEPGGWTYQMLLSVPDSMPAGGYPVCIVLHGANVPPDGLFQTMATELPDHVVVAPTGYELGWNICNEASNAPDMEMVEELIDRMQGFANVNPSAIRIVGFSNGAALANQCFIQNPDPGIDAVVTIVSQLAEIQFRNGSYFAPVADPIEAAPFCGYLQPTAARTDRRYLNICNVNDDTIFYEGGLAPVSGLSYLEARMSAFRVAQQMGYQGPPDLGDGQKGWDGTALQVRLPRGPGGAPARLREAQLEPGDAGIHRGLPRHLDDRGGLPRGPGRGRCGHRRGPRAAARRLGGR